MMQLIQDQDNMPRVVETVRNKIGYSNLMFQFSTINEFIKTISDIKDANSKFPFFFIHSIGVKYDDTSQNVICDVQDIIIATDSKPDWTREFREEQSMIRLREILDAWLDRLRIDHKIDIVKYGNIVPHYFYGNTGISGYEGEVFPEHVDAIHLLNFQFRIKNNNIYKK